MRGTSTYQFVGFMPPLIDSVLGVSDAAACRTKRKGTYPMRDGRPAPLSPAEIAERMKRREPEGDVAITIERRFHVVAEQQLRTNVRLEPVERPGDGRAGRWSSRSTVYGQAPVPSPPRSEATRFGLMSRTTGVNAPPTRSGQPPRTHGPDSSTDGRSHCCLLWPSPPDRRWSPASPPPLCTATSLGRAPRLGSPRRSGWRGSGRCSNIPTIPRSALPHGRQPTADRAHEHSAAVAAAFVARRHEQQGWTFYSSSPLTLATSAKGTMWKASIRTSR